jgi:hypothetical protein
MPYKGGVQLLPETQRRPTFSSYTSQNKYFYTGLFFAAVVVIGGAILGSYKANLTDRINALDGQLQQTEDGRNKDQEKSLIAAARQSKIMRGLLGSKIYWSQALGYMERMMQSSVQLQSLDASVSKGTITFRASTGDYASVARQLAAFTAGTGVKDINLKSVRAMPQGRIEFEGELVIDTKTMLNKLTAK